MKEQQLHFLISKTAPIVQRADFIMSSEFDYSGYLRFEHTIPPEIARLCVFVVRNTKGQVRLQKMLSSSDVVIGLGEDYLHTTIGGIPGMIEDGRWCVELYLNPHFVNRLGDINIDVAVIVSSEEPILKIHVGKALWVEDEFTYENMYLSNKERLRWYRGDFHCHTSLSDGDNTPEEATENAINMGLDFYIATEHNLLHTGWYETNQLSVFPGVEVTTEQGHANIFGISFRPDFLDKAFIATTKAECKKVLSQAANLSRENGWLFSINHPFLYTWKWKYKDINLDKVNCIEIINDPTYAVIEEAEAEKANELAVMLCDLLWKDGHRICGIGGSDSHKKIDDYYDGANEPSVYGDPMTSVLASDLKPEKIYESVRRCRVVVSRYLKDVKIKFRVLRRSIPNSESLFYPGDILPNDTTYISWEIDAKNIPEGAKVFFIIYNEIKSGPIQGKRYCKLKDGIEIPKGQYTMLRLGMITKDGKFLMYANPVTIGSKHTTLETFGEAKKALMMSIEKMRG